MNTDTTAMWELIDRIDTLFKKGHDDAGLRTCKLIATELLSKEKEQIESAYRSGWTDQDDITPTQYIENTYPTK